jgi:hypothetical protein
MLNKIKNNYILIAILIFAAILRIYHIDFQSVWLDEIHTINESNPNYSLSELYSSLLITEPHPPLYFVLIHFSFILFGYTPFVLKFFSFIMGIGGLITTYYLGKELINKKTGLIATFLLAINYFHIYYSQEGRMYSMLYLTTTISFYFLIKFIKKPNLRSALLHAFFASIMIYTHFFALFALFSQYLILLYFVIKPIEVKPKKMFIYSFISGVTTLILYIPSFKLLIETSQKKTMWISTPTIDVYTQLFKEFFGNSEVTIFFILLILMFLFNKIFNLNNKTNNQINLSKSKLIFSFFILIIWIVITLIIPLISSYINLPMIISRYFINILPAIIILIAIGLNYIKNTFVKYTVISVIFLFSISDTLIVKKYYNKINKTQFRETTDFIKKNYNNNEEIVSSLGWYLPYFFNNENIDSKIITKTIDEYVFEKNNINDLKSFWYFDAHNRPFSPSEKTNVIIDSIYIVNENINLFDCYAKHFVLKKDYKPNISVSKFKPFKERNGEEVNYSVEVFSDENNKIEISGWVYFINQEAKNSNIYLVLIDENNEIILNVDNVQREDVTSYFKSEYNISNSGFKTTILKQNLKKGKYNLAVYIIDNEKNKEAFVLTDKFFSISQ